MLDIVVQNLYSSQKYKYWLLMCNLGSLSLFLSLILYKMKFKKNQLLHRICSVKSQTVRTVNFIKHLSVCST